MTSVSMLRRLLGTCLILRWGYGFMGWKNAPRIICEVVGGFRVVGCYQSAKPYHVKYIFVFLV